MSDFAGCSDSQYSTVLTTFGGDANLTMAVCTSLANFLNQGTQNNLPASQEAASLDDLKYGVDSAWLISSGALVFLMHGK